MAVPADRAAVAWVAAPTAMVAAAMAMEVEETVVAAALAAPRVVVAMAKVAAAMAMEAEVTERVTAAVEHSQAWSESFASLLRLGGRWQR